METYIEVSGEMAYSQVTVTRFYATLTYQRMKKENILETFKMVLKMAKVCLGVREKAPSTEASGKTA